METAQHCCCMCPTQMCQNTPKPHTKYHRATRSTWTGLKGVGEAQDYCGSQDFPPLLWRLGTPHAHQQQLPLRVLTAFCFPHRQIGLAPATPTAVVTYLCPEFTPGLLASHLQPRRQRLATARLCEHTAVVLSAEQISFPHCQKKNKSPASTDRESRALERLQNVALIFPSPCSAIMHTCLWKQLLSYILPLPRAQNQISQKAQTGQVLQNFSTSRLEVELYQPPPNFLYFLPNCKYVHKYAVSVIR